MPNELTRGQYQTNVIGAVAVTNAFLPLIEKGTQKKVINISTGGGDFEFVEKTGYTAAVAYGISKAALNFINAKYGAEFRGKGYTFLAISPGLVDTQTGVREYQFPRSVEGLGLHGTLGRRICKQNCTGRHDREAQSWLPRVGWCSPGSKPVCGTCAGCHRQGYTKGFWRICFAIR